MRTTKKAKLLRLHFGESERYQGKPLYEAIVHRCKELKIAGATVFRGHRGVRRDGGNPSPSSHQKGSADCRYDRGHAGEPGAADS